MRALVGEGWNPETWGGDVWENHVEDEDFEPSDSEGFISSEELISPPSTEIAFPHPVDLPCTPLPEETNLAF